MSFRAELACAARAMRAHADRLPEHLRPNLAELWAELTDELDNCRSEGARELAVIEWRRDVESRLTTRLLHAPLPDEDESP